MISIPKDLFELLLGHFGNLPATNETWRIYSKLMESTRPLKPSESDSRGGGR